MCGEPLAVGLSPYMEWVRTGVDPWREFKTVDGGTGGSQITLAHESTALAVGTEQSSCWSWLYGATTVAAFQELGLPRFHGLTCNKQIERPREALPRRVLLTPLADSCFQCQRGSTRVADAE